MALFNYECDEVKRIIEEVSPNYPQLTTYTSEWLYFYEHEYTPGTPVDLEYQEVIVNTYGSVSNAIPYQYKSAILKGNTLVNLLNKLTVNGEVGQTTEWYTTTYTTGTVKSGTYILLYHVKETSGTTFRNTPGVKLADGTYLYHGYENFNSTTGIKKWIFTTDEDLTGFGYWLTYNTGKVVVEDFILLEYQEGMENWDIPYFEGMQSVKMPVLTTSNEDGTKTNILTVNEEVELRGIDEVKDELNLLTGELTQRIGEIVLDGSENWVEQTGQTDVRGVIYRLSITDIDTTIDNRIINCVCDKAMVGSWNVIYSSLMDKTFAVLSNQQLRVQFDGSLEELRAWLLEVQPTVQYFKTESVKTVDLIPLNKPYEGTNHYHLTSNIPCEVILKVPVVSTGEQTLEEINND